MNATTVSTLEKPQLSIKGQTLAAAAAAAGAVAVPQAFHAIGAISGAGTVPGEIFLPMHLPIMLVGLLAGPYAGLAAGLLGPLISFALSGMPGALMLPFMMAELGAYGITAGLLRDVKMPLLGKVVAVQISGRLVRAAAILIGAHVFGSAMQTSVIWTSVLRGLPGLMLQWILLPLIVFFMENRNNDRA